MAVLSPRKMVHFMMLNKVKTLEQEKQNATAN